MVSVKCHVCGNEFQVLPYRANTAKFCSGKCAGVWRKENYAGEKGPNYSGGKFNKCEHCQKEFWVIPVHKDRKFCSKPCADKGGFRHTGESHPNYRADARRKNRGGHHHKWVNAVLSRDKATCQHCGATGVELHAHHIKSYKDHPDLRFDLDNGITLCYKCHWAVHAALTAKAVNSGKLPPGNAEDNPEPSLRGNLLEGVTTRGRASRRVVGPCSWCGNILSKRLSDVANRKHMFCNKHCAGKYVAANRTYRTWKNPEVYGSNASTSAAPERDDIV